MSSSPSDVQEDRLTRTVQSSLVERYAQPLLILALPATFAWALAYARFQSDLAAKAPREAVEALQREIKSQGETLRVVERRQLRTYCAEYPQSLECQPLEHNLP